MANTAEISSPVFTWHEPKTKSLPIILSIPHAGTLIPERDRELYKEDVLAEMADTDWLVDELYSFAYEMGIPSIKAHYSRYVIDLNRPLDGGSLYDDDRDETAVIPKETLAGDKMYRYKLPTAEVIQERITSIYQPFHEEIAKQLKLMRQVHEHVLLFDVHSTARVIPRVCQNPLPDLLLGDRFGTSAAAELSYCAVTTLGASDYSFNHNVYFQGGYIAKRFGNPREGIHALQLDVADDLYLASSASRPEMDSRKVNKLRPLLMDLFARLAATLGSLGSQ